MPLKCSFISVVSPKPHALKARVGIIIKIKQMPSECFQITFLAKKNVGLILISTFRWCCCHSSVQKPYL